MKQYLYGASVQGIQQFIFSTNKLREISGASEIVEHICTGFLKERLNDLGGYEEDKLLVGAAGNIKYLFDDKEACERFVYDFPRLVMKMAPGITVSQAVVNVEGEVTDKNIRLLEARLKAQRSRPIVQHGLGWMVSERSRRTGKPGVEWRTGVAIDAAQQAKRTFTEDSKCNLLKKLIPDSKGKGYHRLFPVEMEDIAGGKDKKNWVAIIHVDGNDLGKKIMKMAKGNLGIEAFRSFSERIGNATEQAAREAFNEVVRRSTDDGDLFPFRPIVLGGDDLTVIIRGDLAIDFTHVFLKAFEEKTEETFADFISPHFHGGLTACAGIAYIKSNYPFHYGVHLAEVLCGHAKEVAKNMKHDRTPACLVFHKVHSSFIDDYKSIVEQELTTKVDNLRLDFGPYFLTPQSNYATIDELKDWVKALNEKASPKSRLRNWLSNLQVNRLSAEQEMNRIKEITPSRYVKKLNLKEAFVFRGQQYHTRLFDALILSSIETNRK